MSNAWNMGWTVSPAVLCPARNCLVQDTFGRWKRAQYIWAIVCGLFQEVMPNWSFLTVLSGRFGIGSKVSADADCCSVLFVESETQVLSPWRQQEHP